MHVCTPPPIRTKQGLIDGSPELSWALFWVGGVPLGSCKFEGMRRASLRYSRMGNCTSELALSQRPVIIGHFAVSDSDHNTGIFEAPTVSSVDCGIL